VAVFYNLLSAFFWELPRRVVQQELHLCPRRMWREVRMLVLSRKIGEAVMVGDNIRITVLEIRGDKVRLGFVAPDEVTVDRLEVHEKRMNQRDEWAKPEFRSYSWPEMS
jgi:carbon storage regulator